MTESAGCRDSARPRLSGGQQKLAMLVVRRQIHLSRANGSAEFRALTISCFNYNYYYSYMQRCISCPPMHRHSRRAVSFTLGLALPFGFAFGFAFGFGFVMQPKLVHELASVQPYRLSQICAAMPQRGK